MVSDDLQEEILCVSSIFFQLQQIFRYNGILLSRGQGFCLGNDEIFVALKPIRMAVRTDIDFCCHDRVASHTHFVQGGVAYDSTCLLCSVC